GSYLYTHWHCRIYFIRHQSAGYMAIFGWRPGDRRFAGHILLPEDEGTASVWHDEHYHSHYNLFPCSACFYSACMVLIAGGDMCIGYFRGKANLACFFPEVCC